MKRKIIVADRRNFGIEPDVFLAWWENDVVGVALRNPYTLVRTKAGAYVYYHLMRDTLYEINKTDNEWIAFFDNYRNYLDPRDTLTELIESIG